MKYWDIKKLTNSNFFWKGDEKKNEYGTKDPA